MNYITETISYVLWHLGSFLQELSHVLPAQPWFIYAILLIAFDLTRRLYNDGDHEIIHVVLPDAAKPEWKGAELEKPDIKEHGLSGIQCYDPATGQRLGIVQPVSVNGIDRTISAAREAQIEWAKTSFDQRRKVLRTILKFVLNNQEAIARVSARDSGKPMLDAAFGEVMVTAEKLQWTIKHGEKALQPSGRPTNFLMLYKQNTVLYEPLGVVAALVSWNYPFHNLIGPVISAIFAGNAIIVKPSERTAWSAPYFLEIIRAALRSCGHSTELVHALPMWPETAGHLTSHPGIQHITFIGSQNVCKHVLKSSAKAIIPVCAELGGKDPAIVLDDLSNSRFKAAAHIMLRGIFQNTGQNCIGTERVIVLPRTYERLVEFLKPKIESLRVGAPLNSPNIDVGAMISSMNFDRLEHLIADAVKNGARLLVGGKRWINPDFPQGHYFQPTLLVDVIPSMAISQEELFAPVCVLMKAVSIDHAITIANSTPYSLGASVFGRSTEDINRVIREVRAGMVNVNDFGASYAVQLPFGGVAGSGYGRFAGEEGLRSLCNIKAVCQDRFWGISTSIPPPHLYPIANTSKAWIAATGIVALGYGNLLQKATGLWNILRNLI